MELLMCKTFGCKQSGTKAITVLESNQNESPNNQD